MATVKLLSYTPDAERLIASAAKLCYSSASIEKLMEKQTKEAVEKFLSLLSDMGHESPVEHVSFTFGIEGVSRAFLAQVTRHRIASYSVQSQRYVAEASFTYVTPPEIEKDPKAKEIFVKAMQEAQNSYNALYEWLSAKHFAQMKAEGEAAGHTTTEAEEKKLKTAADKKAMEDARFVLPNACDTKMILTMNVRSLRHFFRLRTCNRAQWEIHEVADQMLKLCKQAAPLLFASSGPSCLGGACPEGVMTCGKIAEVREKYRNFL